MLPRQESKSTFGSGVLSAPNHENAHYGAAIVCGRKIVSVNLVPGEFKIFIPNAPPNVSTVDSKRASAISGNDSQIDTLDLCSKTVHVQIDYKILFADINPANTCNLWSFPAKYHNPRPRLVSFLCKCIEHLFGVNPVSRNRPWQHTLSITYVLLYIHQLL